MNRHMLVIIMTAFGSKNIVLEALRGRADDFIEKPFRVNELRKKVREIIKNNFYSGNNKQEKRVDRIRRLIQRNATDISLNQIASEVNLHPKYISRFFQEKNLRGFRSFKIDVKIEKAKALLIYSDLKVEEISSRLGYATAESFMRIFKKQTSLTTKEYRRRVASGQIKPPQKLN